MSIFCTKIALLSHYRLQHTQIHKNIDNMQIENFSQTTICLLYLLPVEYKQFPHTPFSHCHFS